MHRRSPFFRSTPLSRTTPLTLATALALALSPPALAQSSATPQVITLQEAGQTLEEYRIDGRLYAIRVTPASGPAYFLLDTTGNGNFERVNRDRVAVPDWVRDE